VHAFKILKRINRIKYVSVSFDGLSAEESAEYQKRLRLRLAHQVRQHGRFEITAKPGRLDWYVTFQHSWPERELDAALNAVATELNAMMFIEPGIPEREMKMDLQSFFFLKWTERDRPTN
jgi:hypothetical protein